jgi:hypothetical protein
MDLEKITEQIGKGIVPNNKVLRKSNLTLDDINQIRRNSDLPELELSDMPRDYRKIHQEKKQVKSNTIQDLFDYFQGKIKVKSTLTNYVSRWKNLFFDILKFSMGDSIRTTVYKWIKDFKKMDSLLRTEFDNFHTLRAYYQAVMKIVSDYPPIHKELSDDLIEEYEQNFIDVKNLERAYQANKTASEINAVLPWKEVKGKILETFPKYSQESLLIHLYDAIPARDNFGNVIIKEDVHQAKDKKQNYLIFNEQQQKPLLLLNQYKTVNTYGPIRVLLPRIVGKILTAMKKKDNDYLITTNDGEPYSRGRLSGMVHEMLQKSGIEAVNSINYLRQSRINDMLRELEDSGLSEKAQVIERAKIAKLAMHTPSMALNYVRKEKTE